MPAVTALHRLFLALAVLVAVTALAGCKSRGDEFEMKGSAEKIHALATRDIERGNFSGAIQKLELLEARFPFSDPAKQGQLDLIYAYYKNREPESAIDQADQFIRENPAHPRVDYAYYIKGLVYFESGANWLERAFKADITKRPPQEARKSFQSFQTLIQQYPKSPYAADSRQRMVYLRNRLADYELGIARYYMTRGAYVGAINRARGLIEGYDGAPAVQRSLALMAEAYRELDMDDLAQVAEQVSVQNDVPDLINPVAGTAGLATSPESAGGLGSGAAYREGRWEGRVGLVAANSADVDFEGGTTAAIDGGTGFLLGIGYHYNARLQFGSTFTYDQKDYSADVAGDEPGETYPIEGDLDSMTLMFDAAYNFLTGPLTPFVSAGVGWSWVDTNVATAPPEIGCWWHPWWGYVCTSFQDTRTFDGLAYEIGLGVRYDFNDVLAADGSYKMRWVDYSNATDTPSFDGFQLNLIWKF